MKLAPPITVLVIDTEVFVTPVRFAWLMEALDKTQKKKISPAPQPRPQRNVNVRRPNGNHVGRSSSRDVEVHSTTRVIFWIHVQCDIGGRAGHRA